MSEHLAPTPSVKRLQRSAHDRWIAGVCGGLARYFDLNPAIFRLGLVVLTLVGGAGVLVYIAAVLVLPPEGEERSLAERVLAERREHPGRLVAVAVVAVALFGSMSQAHSWPSAGAFWMLVLIVGLVALWASRERRAHRLVLAVVAAVATLLVAAIAAVAVAFAWFDVSLSDGVGDRTYAPATIDGGRRSYELGIGDLRVDLSSLELRSDVRVAARLGIGELTVVVPPDVRVVVDTHVKAGDVTGLDSTGGSSTATLFVTARVGAGHIDVVRAS